VSFQAREIIVVEGLHRCVLDGAVHPLGLAVCPGMVGFGEPMLDAVLIADTIEDVNPPACGRTGAVSRRVGKLDAIVGQHDPYLVGKGLDDAAQESRGNHGVRLLVELDIGELRDAIDGKEHVDLAFGQTQLADVDMDVTDGGLGEAATLRQRLCARGKAADPVAFEAAMKGAAGELRNAVTQAAENVVEGQERPPPELDDDRFFDRGQHRAPRIARPHRGIGGCRASPPLRHRLRVQAVTLGKGPGARFRRLELGSNTRRRAGAAMK